MTNQETLILGIGNTLLTDEGSGIHALSLFQSAYPDIPNITCIDGGTLSFTLACWIEECDNLIVFDAAELQQPAGTVRTLVGEDMDRFLGAAKRSAHEVGLLDLFDIARLTCSLPQNRALIGIQPQEFGWGMQPCEAVRQALPIAVEAARGLIESWHATNDATELLSTDDNNLDNPELESLLFSTGNIPQ